MRIAPARSGRDSSSKGERLQLFAFLFGRSPLCFVNASVCAGASLYRQVQLCPHGATFRQHFEPGQAELVELLTWPSP
jgi:hypothetical protein